MKFNYSLKPLELSNGNHTFLYEMEKKCYISRFMSNFMVECIYKLYK